MVQIPKDGLALGQVGRVTLISLLLFDPGQPNNACAVSMGASMALANLRASPQYACVALGTGTV